MKPPSVVGRARAGHRAGPGAGGEAIRRVVALDPDLVALLDAHFDEDLDRSVRIRPGRWDDRSLTQRTVEQFVLPIRRFF